MDFHPDEGVRLTEAGFNEQTAQDRIIEICFTDKFRWLAGAGPILIGNRDCRLLKL